MWSNKDSGYLELVLDVTDHPKHNENVRTIEI